MTNSGGRVVLDLGATRVKFGYSEDGKTLRTRNSYRLQQYRNPGELLEAILDGNPMTDGLPWVIGVPSPTSENKMAETPNLPESWQGKALSEALRDLEIQYTLENDANLAALGDFHHGTAQDDDDIVCLTLGTGIGGGLIIDGSLYRGHSGAAGEIGHITLIPDGRPCGCGNRGCLERYGSATGLMETYEHLTGENLNTEEIIELYPGDEPANKAVSATGIHLGRGLAILCNVLEPDRFVLAGGLSKSLDYFRNDLREAFEQNVFASRTRSTPIDTTSLDEPALYGALELPLAES